MERLEGTTANWSIFMGNNHNYLKSINVKYGGGVSFTKHIGKPLSQSLWDDLVHRLLINSFRIYKYDESEWTDGTLGKLARIRLDEKENVVDIDIYI